MISTQTTSTQQTPFELQLKEYFPDLYTLHTLSKFDKNYVSLIEALASMTNGNRYGTVETHFNNGKISYVFKRENLTASRSTSS